MHFAQKRGLKREKKVAELEGGRTQPGSGARWHSKGDVKTADKLIQLKTTFSKGFRLNLKDLEAIEQQAAAQDRDAEFIVEFHRPEGIKRYSITRKFQ